MKTLKKALSIVLGLAIMLSCVMGMQVSVAAEGNSLTVTVGEVSAKAGETVVVPVSISNNTGFRALGLEVTYDQTVLTLTSVERVLGPDFQEQITPGDNVGVSSEDVTAYPYVMQWAYVTDENITANGAIANLTFTVKEDAVAGTEAFVKADVTFASDKDEDDVTTTADAGAVTVASAGPVLDTTIEQGNSYAAVNDTISLVFLLKHKTVTNAGYDDYKVEFSRQTFTNQYMYNEALDVQEISKTTATSSTSYYQYSGIGMYEMNIPIVVTVKCYKDSEYVAYNQFTLNVKDMIIAVYNNANTADSMKTLIVDLLNLGSEAQKYFGAEGTDLAGVELPTTGFDVEQTTVFDPDALATTESYVLGDDYQSSGITVSFNLNIAKNPGVYYVIGKMATSTYPKADVTIETTYTNGLNSNVVTDSVVGTDATFAGSRYYYVFNKVAFYDLSQVVTTTVKHNDKTVATVEYTVESYIKKNYTNETQGDLFIALAKFSKSARYHFIEK